MRRAPLGYRVENGSAMIDEAGAARVRTLFAAYNSGLALKDAAKKAGITGYHSSIGRILKNRRYLGDDYYPALIDEATFEKAQQLRLEKAKSLGRIYDYTDAPGPTEQKKITFKLEKVPHKFEDPYEQAAFAYSLIEMEEADGE